MTFLDTPPTKKPCKGCLKVKPYWAFYQRPDALDGRVGKCKSCMRAAVQKRRDAAPEQSRSQEASYRADRRRRNVMDRVRRLVGEPKIKHDGEFFC